MALTHTSASSFDRENYNLYTEAEDEILKSLLHVRGSIKLSVRALEEIGSIRSVSSVAARRKHLRNPSRRKHYQQVQDLKRKTNHG